MTQPVTLVDADPLVAALNPRDEHHRWVVEQMAHLGPGVTCEAALTEAAFLVARDGEDPARVVDYVQRGVVTVQPVFPAHAGRVAALMRKYADTPMSLTDACLVVLAEQRPEVADPARGARVFTLDMDVQVYCLHGRRRIPLLAPFA